ncbi:uncharacterized protein LOC128989152 [Macrosteles quadrilineatus]|uniref:uncharacterized protein LOC128989152 n=1 Tax=Macrosteles quadrilineatus TaxID=74068 RepID=UPI0023E232BB|nr:uncharacterized protein LOC128989152 [Macrosteles quadrilineatus]
MESKVFTSEQDDALIDLVRENPVIFDLSQKNYKDVLVKKNVWKKISTELGKNEEDCRTRWKTIRDTYRRNMNRLKEKTKTGSPAFQKSKYINKNLNFLEKCTKKRNVVTSLSSASSSTSQVEVVNTSNQGEKPETNASSSQENQATDASVISHHEDTVMNEEGFAEDVLFRRNSFDLDNDDDIDEAFDAENVAKGVNKGKKKNVREKVLDEIKIGRLERSKLLSNLLSNETKPPQKDHPVDMFFLSMAEVVKQFPPHIITEARLKVCQVVSELELKAMQENTRPAENVITVTSRSVTPNLTVHTLSSGDSADVVLPPTFPTNPNQSYIFGPDDIDANIPKTFIKL